MNNMVLDDTHFRVLMAIGRLPRFESYASQLREAFREDTRSRISRGRLYAVLKELEEMEFVRTYEKPPGTRRGERRRQCYELSPEGSAQLRRWLDRLYEVEAKVVFAHA